MPLALASDPLDIQHSAGDALPRGTRLDEFEVRSVLGIGGFGIVYLAWDHALEREVAVKEYMPLAFAGRDAGVKVTLRSQAQRDTFATGLRSFVNEARLLARFDHPALVKVHRFWEGNGTAYMVMPYYRGRTLRQVRQTATLAPDEAACRRLIDPLLSALELLHGEDVFHRDIAPDNILVGSDDLPVLLDFGAARKVISTSQSLTAILKPNFAPLEQYGDVSSMSQGPWTDLYALGATVHYLLTGRAPPPAASRALCDEFVPLAARGSAGCSARFLEALDWTLALRPQERPPDVATLLAALDGRIAAPRQVAMHVTRPSASAAIDVKSGAMASTTSPSPTGSDFDPTQAFSRSEAIEPAHATQVDGTRGPDRVAPVNSQRGAVTRMDARTMPIDDDGAALPAAFMPTVPIGLSNRSGSPESDTAARLPAELGSEWLWLVRYFSVALLASVLAASAGNSDLFMNTVLVPGKLTAAHLAMCIGYAGALFVIWMSSARAAVQLRDHGGKAAFLHHFVPRLAALVVTPCAYAALLPVVRPFMDSTQRSVYDWTFILATTGAAGWLALSIFRHSDSLTASAHGARSSANGARESSTGSSFGTAHER